LFASEGAEVTVLDYSPEAIRSSKLFFERNNVKSTSIQADAFNLDKNLLRKFDVAMSYGTAEHFKGKQRIDFIKLHFDVLKECGIVFIEVPNSWNIPYRLWKFLSQLSGRWAFGEEYPFSIIELKKIAKLFNKKCSFMGKSLFRTQFCFFRRIKKLFKIKETYDLNKIRKEIGTPLDTYFSTYLILVGENKK
jgi:2-polyprenyl-3-methyl-5-hydroxy-6-metoxy-1,4-benzoquinol methylase